MQDVVIGAMATLVVVELFVVLYYYQKTKAVLEQLQQKKLEAANMTAVNLGLEVRLGAEKKTAQERADLINSLIDAAGKGRGDYKGK